jgi:phosphatidate cytidylyltransferase
VSEKSAESNNLSDKFAGLLQRVQTAVVLLLILSAPVLLGGFWFLVILAIVGVIMAREWVGLLQSEDPGRDALWISLLMLNVLIYGYATSLADALALIVFISLVGAALSFKRGSRFTPVFGGLIYIAWPLAAASGFRDDAMGLMVIFYILVSVWAVDIFAMFSGKIIGGPKLAPRLSPNKTWAGMLGAILGALVAAALSYGLIVSFDDSGLVPNVTALAVLAVVLAVVAQGADLFESWLKRKYQIKDSGNIFPGHGGILDRVDGLVGVLIFLHLLTLVRGVDISQALWVWS